MKTYTDQEVLTWITGQIGMFKGMAQGFGFEAIQARQKLLAIEKLNDQEKIRIGRLNLETIEAEGKYLSQLPK